MVLATKAITGSVPTPFFTWSWAYSVLLLSNDEIPLWGKAWITCITVWLTIGDLLGMYRAVREDTLGYYHSTQFKVKLNV